MHLSLIAINEAVTIPRILNAGAIFLGHYSPVATGDFVVESKPHDADGRCGEILLRTHS